MTSALYSFDVPNVVLYDAKPQTVGMLLKPNQIFLAPGS
jgi:hypothetical protein